MADPNETTSDPMEISGDQNEVVRDSQEAADDATTLTGLTDIADVASDTTPSVTAGSIPAHTTQPRKGSKLTKGRVLLIVSLLAVVLAACGFGGYRYGVEQYNQLNALGTQMCDELITHNYDALYQHFSDSLKARYLREEFVRYGAQIDRLEGNAISCGQTAGNHFSVDMGQRAITVASHVNREGSGEHIGAIRFQFTGSSWKVDDIDPGFLGVSLDALHALERVCNALTESDSSALYQLLAPGLRSVSQQQFTDDFLLHQKIDGYIVRCDLEGIGKANTASSATLTVHIVRDKYEAAHTVTLGKTSSGWVLTDFDPTLQGRDITPVSVVSQWCSDIKSQSYTGAFGLLTSRAQQFTSAKALAAKYSGKSGGVKWLDCTVDPATYHGDTLVTLIAQVHDTSRKRLEGALFTLLPEEKTWKIDTIFMCANLVCAGL